MNVTIVGGGFGGVRAALDIAKHPEHHVTLITDRPDFQYYPALYSTATGHSHLESWVPLGEIFADHTNVRVVIDKVTSIDAKKKLLNAESGTIYHYQTVIFAMGVVTTYFGIPGLETYAYGIKNEDEIQKLKHRLYIDIAEKNTLDKNYVVIGAGPTGVELAAAIGTYVQHMCKRYRVRSHRVRVRLIEASPRVLPRSHPSISQAVTKRLKKLGVIVETNKKVESENAHSVVVSGKPIASHTVIWTSGVANHPFFAEHPEIFTLAPNHRVQVDKYLRAAKDIYVIGDNAATPYTGLAQTALRDGKFVAKNLVRKAKGKSMKPYSAFRPVSVVPVGARWASVEWGNIRFYGWLGSVIRRFADLTGYSEILPFGTSLGVWRAATVHEDDYFCPTGKNSEKLR